MSDRQTNHGKMTKCDRCGIERMIRHGARTTLCRDCHTALTPAEREAWVVKPKLKPVPLKRDPGQLPTPVRSITELGAMNLGVRIGAARRAS